MIKGRDGVSKFLVLLHQRVFHLRFSLEHSRGNLDIHEHIQEVELGLEFLLVVDDWRAIISKVVRNLRVELVAEICELGRGVSNILYERLDLFEQFHAFTKCLLGELSEGHFLGINFHVLHLLVDHFLVEDEGDEFSDARIELGGLGDLSELATALLDGLRDFLGFLRLFVVCIVRVEIYGHVAIGFLLELVLHVGLPMILRHLVEFLLEDANHGRRAVVIVHLEVRLASNAAPLKEQRILGLLRLVLQQLHNVERVLSTISNTQIRHVQRHRVDGIVRHINLILLAILAILIDGRHDQSLAFLLVGSLRLRLGIIGLNSLATDPNSEIREIL